MGFSESEKRIIQGGQILSKLTDNDSPIQPIYKTGFQVYSQWDDDGIIQYLVNYLDISKKVFVEFGVEDYKEANTRFLLVNNNWSGMVMDGSKDHINSIRKDPIYWRYDLVAKEAFVTAENINVLLSDDEFKGKIGLLHIDVDGNDYWIWKNIDIIDPDIAIVEYNSVFGYERAITVPYSPKFFRTAAHYSNLYAGASLLALCDLAETKGYAFVGCNRAGNNAYFVKKELMKDLKPLSAREGYVESKFRESRDKKGSLTYLRGAERLALLNGMPVYNTREDKIEKL